MKYPVTLKGSLRSFVRSCWGISRGRCVVAIPEYKIGPRWEPSQYATIALTDGHEFAGPLGAGFEFGVMLFTPPFACLGGCGGAKKGLKGIFK